MSREEGLIRTWTNSTGLLSPAERLTESREAGKPCGTTLSVEEPRRLDMTSEEMVTGEKVSVSDVRRLYSRSATGRAKAATAEH